MVMVHIVTLPARYTSNHVLFNYGYCQKLQERKHGCLWMWLQLYVYIFLIVAVLVELLLEIVNYILVHLECLGQNIGVDGRIRSKDCVCYGDHPRILAAETGKGDCIGLSHIKLEVNETNWEHKDVSLIQNFGEETVICVRCDKTYIQSTLSDHYNLRATRVGMGRI